MTEEGEMTIINKILSKYPYGILLDKDDEIHGCGFTNKNIWVWLPKISVNDYWINDLHDSEGFIIQIGKRKQTDFITWTVGSGIVITRCNNTPQRLDGKYHAVFYNESKHMAIHIKDADTEKNPPTTIAAPLTDGNISWLPSFAGTAEEAHKKADMYIEKASEEVKNWLASH
jgi:hypothetical protein